MTPRELAAEGAPVEQGTAQGRVFAGAIARELARQRKALPWLARRALLQRVRETSARAVASQLPWQRERLEGIALAARVPLSGLELAEALDRVQGAAFVDGTHLQASFDLRHPRRPSFSSCARADPTRAAFRAWRSALAHLSGCLCGVNAEGIAAICVRDLGRDEPSLRFHAQEIVFRARDLTAGIDHLRRRASYAGGSGTLVVADASGEARVLDFERGVLRVSDCERLAKRAAEPMVEIDTDSRRLRWTSGEPREAHA